MANDGQILGRPPVTVWSSLARAELACLLHGANLYAEGAGGFGKVPALPQMARIRQPANPNSPAMARDAQIYTQRGGTTIKQRLERQFGIGSGEGENP